MMVASLCYLAELLGLWLYSQHDAAAKCGPCHAIADLCVDASAHIYV